MRRCVSCDARFDASTWVCPTCGYEPDRAGDVLLFAPDAAEGDGGFQPEAFDALPEIEEKSLWFTSRNRLIVWAIGRHFPRADSLFDLGCGTGYVLAALRCAFPRLRLTGAELFPEGLSYARGRVPDATFYQLDARDIPFDREFDVVGAFDVLEHCDDDRGFLAGMHRAVKPGGGVVITVPQHPWLWGPSDEYARHCRRYTRRELVAKVRATGLQLELVTSFVSFAFPLMVLSRLRDRIAPASYDPVREHTEARRLDPVFGALARAELELIRRGLSLPVGGSLLAIARRDQA
jgi:SAM-dependent methyltransferase